VATGGCAWCRCGLRACNVAAAAPPPHPPAADGSAAVRLPRLRHLMRVVVVWGARSLKHQPPQQPPLRCGPWQHLRWWRKGMGACAGTGASNTVAHCCLSMPAPYLPVRGSQLMRGTDDSGFMNEHGSRPRSWGQSAMVSCNKPLPSPSVDSAWTCCKGNWPAQSIRCLHLPRQRLIATNQRTQPLRSRTTGFVHCNLGNGRQEQARRCSPPACWTRSCACRHATVTCNSHWKSPRCVVL